MRLTFFACLAVAACGGGSVGEGDGGDGGGPSATSAVESSASSSSSSSISTGTGGAGGSGPATCSVEGHPGVCIHVMDCDGERMATPGACSDPNPAIQCCTDEFKQSCDPMLHVLPNEYLDEEPGDPGCPLGMVKVTTFCIDRYEASLQMLPPAMNRSWSPYFNPKGQAVRAVSIRNAVPQAYISGTESKLACENSKKRLCTDDEWLHACQGPQGFTYPYGDVRMEGVCNDHRDVHPAIEYFGTSASWIWSHLDNACIDQLYESLDHTGENMGCVTAEGAFDMMGNLHEWTADPAGTFRGGYYVDTKINGEGCLYATTAHDVGHWDYSTGFRCCADL